MKTYVPSALEQAIRAWVVAALDIEVIYADQRDAPRPPPPYASVMLISNPPVGEPEKAYATIEGEGDDPDTAEERVRRTFEPTCTVSVFGDAAQDLAEDLLLSIDLDEVKLINRSNALVVVDAISGPTLIGVASGGVPDRRVVTDYQLRYHRTAARAVPDIIESIDITSEV